MGFKLRDLDLNLNQLNNMKKNTDKAERRTEQNKFSRRNNRAISNRNDSVKENIHNNSLVNGQNAHNRTQSISNYGDELSNLSSYKKPVGKVELFHHDPNQVNFFIIFFLLS